MNVRECGGRGESVNGDCSTREGRGLVREKEEGREKEKVGLTLRIRSRLDPF